MKSINRLFVLLTTSILLCTSLIPSVQAAPTFTLIDTEISGTASWQTFKNASSNQYWVADGSKLSVFSVTAGIFTLLTFDNANGSYYDVTGDDTGIHKYIYVALGAEGLAVFGYDAGPTVTFLTCYPTITCYQVWFDSMTATIHGACGNDGLMAFWYNDVTNKLVLQDTQDDGGLYYAITGSNAGQ